MKIILESSNFGNDDLPLPDNGDYVDGSCQVNREFTLEYDKKSNEWVNCQN